MLLYSIRQILISEKTTLRGLSIKLNCSHSWLSQVLNGVKQPNIHLLREVANHTGKSYDYLMSNEPDIDNLKEVDIELLKELFKRRKTNTPQRHIRPLSKKPSFIEQKIIDNIRKTTLFDFSQVTLNYNHLMKPHKHKNIGLSLCMLLGDFNGGALCLENGEKISRKYVWISFDGKQNHWVEPFEGERFSIILYKR